MADIVTNTLQIGSNNLILRDADAQQQLVTVKDGLNSIGTVGINLFDKNKTYIGKYINQLGNEGTNSNFYCSDFIAVEPSTEYKLTKGVGSASAYLTCAYYDSGKTFISGVFTSSTSAFVFTTPSNCAFVRINGSITKLDEQGLTLNISGLSTAPQYQLIVDGKNEQGVYLVSAREIRYNKTDGLLESADNIYLHTPDVQYSLGTSIDVGTTGGFLFWNKKTGAIYTSATNTPNSDIYMLGILSNSKKFDPKKQFCTVDSAFPIFEVDLINNLLSVNVKAQPCYVIYNGVFYTIAKDYTQTLSLSNHCFVFFDVVTNTFGVSNDYSGYAWNKGIPVLVRYYRNVYCRVAYETPITDVAYKNIVCYGDSLTWYDGNDFTWGEHEGETCIGFERYLLNYLNFKTVNNRGVSGKTTPEICTKIKTADDLATHDIMTIMGGDNDDRLSVNVGTLAPVGSTYDTTTVYGALQSAIEWALTQNPSLRIVLMTEPMGWTYRNGTFVRVDDSIPQAYRDVADFYGLPLIDLWNDSGINEFTREEYYADPATNHSYFYHPNNKGWERISKLIYNRLMEV